MSVFEEFKEQQHQQDQKHNDLVGCVVGGPLITSSSNDYDELNSNKHRHITY
jgi:hypothetical protein